MDLNHHAAVTGEREVQPDSCQMAEGVTGAAVTGTGRKLDACATTDGAGL